MTAMDVFVSPEALRSMITSVIEVYNRETNGVLIGRVSERRIGKRKRRVMSVKDIYVYQTDVKKPSQVYHGNIAAFRRALESLKSMRLRVVGGYHCHSYPYNTSRISREDVEYAREEVREIERRFGGLGTENWLEIILSVRRKDYAARRKEGLVVKGYRRKLRCIVVTEPFVGYDIFVSAYWIGTEGRGNVREAEVYTEM